MFLQTFLNRTLQLKHIHAAANSEILPGCEFGYCQHEKSQQHEASNDIVGIFSRNFLPHPTDSSLSTHKVVNLLCIQIEQDVNAKQQILSMQGKPHQV